MQCVAIDPTEERIAAGDTSGRILLWNAFKDKVPQVQKSTPQPAPRPQPAATAAGAATTAVANPAKAAQPPASADSDSDSDSSDSEGNNSESQPPTSSVQSPASKSQDINSPPHQHSNAQAVAPKTTAVVQSQGSLSERFARVQRSIEEVALTTVHWHAHPVASLCFSADGTLLLSGGEEAVLVSSQLLLKTMQQEKTCLPLSRHDWNFCPQQQIAPCDLIIFFVLEPVALKLCSRLLFCSCCIRTK